MRDAFDVRVKRIGRGDYLPPVAMDFLGRVPAVGEIVEVWISGRSVRARVTRIPTSASRTTTAAGVVHDIYADEVA
jgi:hypothetical protein